MIWPLFSFLFVSTQRKVFVSLYLNEGVKLFLCFLSYLTARLCTKECARACAGSLSLKVTRLSQTTALYLRHCYHGNTCRDNSQPLHNSCMKLQQFATYYLPHIVCTTCPCGLAVSSTLIGWRATRWRTPL